MTICIERGSAVCQEESEVEGFGVNRFVDSAAPVEACRP